MVNIQYYRNRGENQEYVFNKTQWILYIKKWEYDERKIREILWWNKIKVIYPMLCRKWNQ